jgi:hypothetical protein
MNADKSPASQTRMRKVYQIISKRLLKTVRTDNTFGADEAERVNAMLELITDSFNCGGSKRTDKEPKNRHLDTKAVNIVEAVLAGLAPDSAAQNRLLSKLIDQRIEMWQQIVSPQLLQVAVAEYVNGLEDHLQRAALHVKLTECISTRQWDRIREAIFSSINQADQKYKPLEIMPGCFAPVVPNSHQLSKMTKELTKELRLTYNPNNKASQLDLHAAILVALESSFKHRELLGEPTVDLTKAVRICLKFDASCCGYGHRLMPFCFVFVDAAISPNCPDETFTFMLADSDDSNLSIRECLGELALAQMRNLKNAVLDFRGHKITFDVTESADGKALLSSAGQGPASSTYCCMYCTAKRSQLNDRTTVFPARTIEWNTALSHTVAGVWCSACNKTIDDKDVADAKAAYADDARRLAHMATHFSVLPGVGSLTGVCPSKAMIFCLLHAHLNITAAISTFMFKHVKSDATAKQIVTYLKGKGIRFKQVRTDAQYAEVLREKSFVGDDCDKLVREEVYTPLLDLCYQDGNQPLKDKTAKVLKLWSALYTEMLRIDDKKDLNPQADQIQISSNKFADAFEELASAESHSLYVHIMTRHAADLVRRFGCLTKFGYISIYFCFDYSFSRFVSDANFLRALLFVMITAVKESSICTASARSTRIGAPRPGATFNKSSKICRRAWRFAREAYSGDCRSSFVESAGCRTMQTRRRASRACHASSAPRRWLSRISWRRPRSR